MMLVGCMSGSDLVLVDVLIKIVSSGDTPVAGVEVCYNGSLIGFTDSSGKLSLTLPQTDSLSTFSIKKTGYQTVEKQLNLSDGQSQIELHLPLLRHLVVFCQDDTGKSTEQTRFIQSALIDVNDNLLTMETNEYGIAYTQFSMPTLGDLYLEITHTDYEPQQASIKILPHKKHYRLDLQLHKKEHFATPTPKVEAPTPKVEAPTPKVEAPTPKVEAPTPKVEAPTPKVEAPTPKSTWSKEFLEGELAKAAEYVESYHLDGEKEYLYQAMKVYEQILQAYDTEGSHIPAREYSLASYRLAHYYLEDKKPLKAMEILTRSLERDSRHAICHFNLGLAYRDMGRPEQAATSFSTTIKLLTMSPGQVPNAYQRDQIRLDSFYLKALMIEKSYSNTGSREMLENAISSYSDFLNKFTTDTPCEYYEQIATTTQEPEMDRKGQFTYCQLVEDAKRRREALISER